MILELNFYVRGQGQNEMSLIVTGPFKIVANNTDKNYFDCLKKYNFGIGDLKMITVHISDVFATTTGTSLPVS